MTHSEADEALYARTLHTPDAEADDGKPAMEHPAECAGEHGRDALNLLLEQVRDCD